MTGSLRLAAQCARTQRPLMFFSRTAFFAIRQIWLVHWTSRWSGGRRFCGLRGGNRVLTDCATASSPPTLSPSSFRPDVVVSLCVLHTSITIPETKDVVVVRHPRNSFTFSPISEREEDAVPSVTNHEFLKWPPIERIPRSVPQN